MCCAEVIITSLFSGWIWIGFMNFYVFSFQSFSDDQVDIPPASSLGNPLYSGYLKKRGVKAFRRGWKFRYCVIHGGFLYWLSSEQVQYVRQWNGMSGITITCQTRAATVPCVAEAPIDQKLQVELWARLLRFWFTVASPMSRARCRRLTLFEGSLSLLQLVTQFSLVKGWVGRSSRASRGWGEIN
jgi:hypothetical protein